MKDEFEYQDALNLFEKVYYTRDGEGKELDTEDGWFGAVEKPKLMNLALKLGDRDYKSKIIGRSAFTPIIKKVLVTQEKDSSGNVKKIKNPKYYKYMLTVQPYRFDRSMVSVKDRDDIVSYDITNMSKEVVINSVKKILSMSNEEIMEKFNIKLEDSRIKAALLTADSVYDFLKEQGEYEKKVEYTADDRDMMTIECSDGEIVNILETVNMNDIPYKLRPKEPKTFEEGNRYIEYSEKHLREASCIDISGEKIFFKVLKDKENSNKEYVKIDEEITHVASKMGTRLLKTLKDKFSKTKNIEEQESYSSGQDKNEKTNSLSVEQIEEMLKEERLKNQIIRAQKESRELDEQIKEKQQERENTI